MKKTIALASIIAILFSVFAFVGTNVFATDYSATTITETTKTLTITRTVSNVTNPVTNNFTYTTELVASPTGSTVGNIPGALVLSFSEKDPDSNNVATETATLDFSSVTFDEIGDYKFTVTETASQYSGTYPVDRAKTYYVYVSVRNAVDANNTPTGQLVVTLASQVKNNDTGDKTDLNYTSESQHTYIELSKNVTGTLARRDTYFPFTITFTDDCVREGDVIAVSNKEGSNYYTTNARYSTVTVDSNKQAVVWLKHGDVVTIGKTENELNQLPIGLKYTITEGTDSRTTAGTDSRTEEYETFIDGSTTNNKSMSQKTTVAVPGEDDDKTAFNTNNKTTYVNKREADPVTGIFINVMPFVALIALAFVGIMVIKKTSRKED